MVKIIIVLIAIQYFVFLFTIKDKTVRLGLLITTRACTLLSKTVVKLTFAYYLWLYVHS